MLKIVDLRELDDDISSSMSAGDIRAELAKPRSERKLLESFPTDMMMSDADKYRLEKVTISRREQQVWYKTYQNFMSRSVIRG